MALLQQSCNRAKMALNHFNFRTLSIKTDLVLEKNIKKSVFISQSKDVYTNLALEEWIYKNFNLKQHHVLMLWQNDPCVVIGRNQNPWSETNFSGLHDSEHGVSIARRSSNGGAIYHDDGNLNVTFFSPRGRYNSKNNSELVARSIFRAFGCKVDMGNQENLVVRSNKQISNKAAKLGRDNAYHNMSLMVASNKVNRNWALEKKDVHIRTQAGNSVPSPSVMNLCEDCPQINVSSLIKAVGWEFLRTGALTMKDGGMENAYNQKGFHKINPTDKWFPGLDEIRNKYQSWDWCFGLTPRFNITQTFTIPGGLIHRNTGASVNMDVTITVEKGRISDITLFLPHEFNSVGFTGEAKVIHELKGKRFSEQAFEHLEDSFGSLLDEKDRFVTECLKQVMTNA